MQIRKNKANVTGILNAEKIAKVTNIKNNAMIGFSILGNFILTKDYF